MKSHVGQIDRGDLPVVVVGHSRGGAVAILGADLHARDGGRLDGIALWYVKFGFKTPREAFRPGNPQAYLR